MVRLVVRTLVLSSLILSANAKPYKTDYDYSSMGFEVKHLSLKSIGGDFSNFVYKVDISDDKLVSISGTIRTNSVNTRDKKRDSDLVKSKDFFDYSKFLRIYFESTKIDKNNVYGDITIKGITKKVKLKYDMKKDKRPDGKPAYIIKLEGSLNRKDFNIASKVANSTLSDKVSIEGLITVYDNDAKSSESAKPAAKAPALKNIAPKDNVAQKPKAKPAQSTESAKTKVQSKLENGYNASKESKPALVQLAPANLTPAKLPAKSSPASKSGVSLKSIKFAPSIDYEFYLDNTERTAPYAQTRTLFTQSLSPKLDFKISETKKFQVGFASFFDMGDRLSDAKTLPLINYSFTSEVNGGELYGKFGIFDRPQESNRPIFSSLLFRDDYLFYNPFINGVQVGGVFRDTNVGLVFNWYGTDLQKRTDKFYVMPYVRHMFKNHISIGANILYDHFKDREYLSSIAPDTGILDRIYYEFYAQADFRKLLNLIVDKLDVKLTSLNLNERKRTASNKLEKPVYGNGGELLVDISYEGFGISNKLYVGNPMMTLFQKDKDKSADKSNPYSKLIHDDVYAGEALYQSPIYNKSTIYYEYADGAMSARFGFSLNATKRILSNSQLFTIKYSFK